MRSRALVAILVGLLLYGSLNLCLFLGQKIYHRGSEARLAKLEVELRSAAADLDRLGLDLKAKEAAIDSVERDLDDIEAVLAGYKKRKPLNSVDQAKYLKSVKEQNALGEKFNRMIALYEIDVKAYDALTATHNARVHEANALKQKTGYWYLIPFRFRR